MSLAFLPPDWLDQAMKIRALRYADSERSAARLIAQAVGGTPDPRAADWAARSLAWLAALRDDEALPAGVFEAMAAAVVGEHTL